MWIVLGVGALVVVLVVVVVAFRRPRADDLHSVRSYHSALGTLENMSDRPGQPAGPTGAPDRSSVGHVRPRFYSRASAESQADAPGDPITANRSGTGRHPGPVPPVPLRNLDAIEDPATPLVFDDAEPDRQATLPAAQGSHEFVPAVRLDRAQRHALESMNRRPRRITAVSIVVAAVVVFAVLAVIGSRRSNSPHHAPSASAATSAGHQAGKSTASTTPAAGHGAKVPPGKKKAITKAPPTTVPTQLVALSSTSTSATYSVAADSYTVTVSASGPCWVSANTVATGSTLWEGTLQAGQVQVIPASGVITVQLGTTAATVKVGKLPVVLPTPLHSPFVATFQTPGTGSASSTGTTATTSATTGASGANAATGATTTTTTAPSAG
jgi:hypothetical protein